MPCNCFFIFQILVGKIVSDIWLKTYFFYTYSTRSLTIYIKPTVYLQIKKCAYPLLHRDIWLLSYCSHQWTLIPNVDTQLSVFDYWQSKHIIANIFYISTQWYVLHWPIMCTYGSVRHRNKLFLWCTPLYSEVH